MPTYRAVVEISDASLGGTGVNTWHLRTTASGTLGAGEADVLMDFVREFYVDTSDLYPSTADYAFDGTFLEVGTEEPEALAGTPWTVAGTSASDVLPPATCLVVGWRTALATRSGRGRTFLGPMAIDTLQDNGSPTEVARGIASAGAGVLIASSLGDLNGALGVWSPTDQVFRDFTSAAVANRFAVLRSRRD